MASRSEVVHCYDQLAWTLSRMRESALARKWEQLPALESHCASLVDRLKCIEPLEALDPAQREEVRQLAARVRADQEAVSALVRPQLERLMKKMEQLQKKQALHRTCRPPCE